MTKKMIKEIKSYINIISKYKLNQEEEQLIEDTVNRVTSNEGNYFVKPAKNVKTYRFNDLSEVELNFLLHKIKVTKRSLEIAEFTTKIALGDLKISDIKIPSNLKIIAFCMANNLKISTCESATSGLVCSRLTDVQGSSEVVEGGYITYTNNQKVRVGVSQLIIDRKGVYSKECALEMAKACKNNTDSNIGIGVTGTLGNLDPNNKDSELGVIYAAFVINDLEFNSKIQLTIDELNLNREEQKQIVVNRILEDLSIYLNTIKENI